MNSAHQKDRANTSLPEDAIAALNLGNKIEAIKIVREEQAIGLKDAKDVVEDYVRGHPGLQSSLEARQSEAKRGLLLWFGVFAVVAILVAYFR